MLLLSGWRLSIGTPWNDQKTFIALLKKQSLGHGAGGPRCILNGLDSELTDALFQISLTCPAVAAHITCNADLSISEIAYHPLWLERSRSLAPMQQQM